MPVASLGYKYPGNAFKRTEVNEPMYWNLYWWAWCPFVLFVILPICYAWGYRAHREPSAPPGPTTASSS